MVISLALILALAGLGQSEGEARISLDVREADVRDVVGLLSEVGGFQVIFDPGISCSLTLKLRQVLWQTALDMSLKTCGLGREEEGGILRVAPVARLREESAARRRYEEEKAQDRPRTVSTFRLSYARAAEVASLVKKYLSPRGDVIFDGRTNTLIIID